MTAADPTYVRNPAIAVTEIDDETFLVEPAEGEVFYLDEISSALLHELGMPLPDVLADLIRKPAGSLRARSAASSRTMPCSSPRICRRCGFWNAN